MKNGFRPSPAFQVYFCLSVLAAMVVGLFLLLPETTGAQQNGKSAKRLFHRTESHEEGLENYDIRTDKKSFTALASFRVSQGVAPFEVADVKESMVLAEESFEARYPGSEIETKPTNLGPEVIGMSALSADGTLTAPSKGSRAEILKNFLRRNDDLVGVSSAEIAELETVADYSTLEGRIGYAILTQSIDGIPVFQGEVKAGFTKNGEIIRIINNLAPGLGGFATDSDFGSPEVAVSYAYGHINRKAPRGGLEQNSAATTENKLVFGEGDAATTAEKFYFPTEPGVVVAAWRVLIWQPTNAYYVVVDAKTGTLLWRKNITEDQTQAATYGVYRNPNAMIDVADSPFPMTPGPNSPNGAQGAGIPRTVLSRIGNEGVYSFNQLGFIPDGVFKTDGNYVQAGLDRDGVNGVDPNSEAFSETRNFVFSYNPWDPNTNTGDLPLPEVQTYPGTAFQQGTVTHMFWVTNWVMSELYRLGFNEQARNFQGDNFGRGGNANDRLSAEGQDSSGTNNANFSTPSDGGRPRMQMYNWTAGGTTAAPRIDGNLDADVIIHEIIHGLSNRLIGNSSGLSLNMSRGMGEGWSDFYAHAMLSEASDPINAIYTTGGYDTFRLGGTFLNNYYYGIRRFPKAVMSFTGGPNNRPHNPLTFADIDSTQANLNDGAFAPAFTGTADQVHAAGEVWSSALWEVRCLMVQRHGWEIGNRRALQIITDGMKLTPNGPTFLQARDAIIAAARASSTTDVEDVWTGFATRGMGRSARVLVAGSGGTTRVVEAFDLPAVVSPDGITVSDSSTGNNSGSADPGETIQVTIPISNEHWATATNVTVTVGNESPLSVPNVSSGSTANFTFTYQVPSNAQCSSQITLDLVITSNLGSVNTTKKFTVGSPQLTYSENFDSVVAPTLPPGWTADIELNSPEAWVTSVFNPQSFPNSAYIRNAATIGGGASLTSPAIQIQSSGAIVSFAHRYATEAAWDGGVLEISSNDGPFIDVIAAGGEFVSNGYNGTLGVSTNNPLNGRNAWNGSSNVIVTSSVRLPANVAGTSVRLRWRFGADDNTVGSGANPGWNIDNIQVFGSFTCSSVNCAITLNPATSTNVAATGGAVAVSVNVTTGCSWTASTQTSWITISSGATGTGNGTVNLSIGANSGSSRSGSVTIGGQTLTINQAAAANGSIAGTVRYYFGASPLAVPNVTLSAAGAQNVSGSSGSNGTFSLTGFGSGAYTLTPSKTGQVGGISSLDASRVAQYSAALITLTPDQLIAADVTNNGSVNSLDAARIAQWIVGITSSGTNITGTWRFTPASRSYSSVTESLTGQDFTAILLGDVTGNWAPPAPIAEGQLDSGTVGQEDGSQKSVTGGRSDVAKAIGFGIYSDIARTRGVRNMLAGAFAEKSEMNDTLGARADGDVVEIPVRVADAMDILAYDAVIGYDSDVLEPVLERPVSSLGTLSTNFNVVVNRSESGKIRLGAYGVVPVTGDGELIVLRFRVKRPFARLADAKLAFESLTINEESVVGRQ